MYVCVVWCVEGSERYEDVMWGLSGLQEGIE